MLRLRIFFKKVCGIMSLLEKIISLQIMYFKKNHFYA